MTDVQPPRPIQCARPFGRQRRLRPSPTDSGEPSSTRSALHTSPGPARRQSLADLEPHVEATIGTGVSPTGHLGGAGRARALTSSNSSAGSPGPRRRLARSATTPSPAPLARDPDEIHADVRANGADERGSSPSTPGPTPSRLAAADGADGVPARHDSGCAPPCWRSPTSSPRTAPSRVPGRGDRRRSARRGGELPDLLPLARLRAGRHRRARPRPRSLRAVARRTPARSASTARSSTPAPAAT